MSRFFIRFTARIKKIGVTISIHARLKRMEIWMLPSVRALVTATALVRGRKSCAAICKTSGMEVNGKNVPLKRNMGVIKRKFG